MANFGRRNLGSRRGNSRDLSPQGPFSGDLSRSKKNPDRGSGFVRGFAAGRSRRAMVSAAGRRLCNQWRPEARRYRPHPSEPPRTVGRQRRKTGSTEKPEVPNGRPQTTGRRRRMAGRNRMTGRAGPRVTTESWPQQGGGPCRTAGRGRKAGRAGQRAVPDGWPRTGYRKSMNS